MAERAGEEVAATEQPYFTEASTLSLFALMVLMVGLNFSNTVGLFGSGGLLASLILVYVTLAGGYLLGSLDKADHWVQVPGSAISPQPWWSPP